MPSELKPCPWCNGPAETRNSRWCGTDHWGVACTGCGNPWFDYRAITEAEAIAAWNQRPEPATPAGEEGLVEELARIIYPSSWAVMDSYLAQMLRKYKGENVAYDPEQYKHKESMTKARAILPIINRREAAAHAAGRAAERADVVAWLQTGISGGAKMPVAIADAIALGQHGSKGDE